MIKIIKLSEKEKALRDFVAESVFMAMTKELERVKRDRPKDRPLIRSGLADGLALALVTVCMVSTKPKRQLDLALELASAAINDAAAIFQK